MPEPAPLGQAIADVTEKAQLLIREEIELAKAEVAVQVKSLLRGSVIGMAAGFFVVVGLFMMLNGFAWLAWYELFPDFQFFWGFFFMAAVLFITAALAGVLAAKLFKSGSPPVPNMAIREAQMIRDTVTSPVPDPETKI